jgi:dihydroorotate dehydrogenase/Pyruvate/2-oxoacid:ferredoxin oxidoreductase delta subunit
MGSIDLSVKIGNLTFSNPILPGSSDIILEEGGVVKCLKEGIGGIVTKTFTSTPLRTRARPYHFNYRVFGDGLENCWITRGGFHPMSPEEAAEKLILKIARLCKDENVPLVVSIGNGAEIDEWVKDARLFEQAGADMLELNLACPHATSQIGATLGSSVGQDIPLVIEIIKSIKKAVGIPISTKSSISGNLYARYVKEATEAGADFFTIGTGTTGMLIDVEKEVPFGGLGAGGYQIGRARLPMGISKAVETRKLTQVPVIGVGGVNRASDALMYLLIGCPLVMICSSIYRKGFGIFGDIIKGIEKWMERKGYSSTRDFIGKIYPLAAKASSPDFMQMEWPFPMPQEQSSPIIPIIDMDKCILCSKCEVFCLSGVFTVDKSKAVVNIDYENKCWGCGDCVGWCPESAIALIDQDSKEMVWDNHGLAKPYRPENWKKGAIQ